jgi:transposase
VRSGARWIDVPERYGRWNSVYRRFRRWSQVGVFEALLETLAGALAQERLQMIDSTIVRAKAEFEATDPDHIATVRFHRGPPSRKVALRYSP